MTYKFFAIGKTRRKTRLLMFKLKLNQEILVRFRSSKTRINLREVSLLTVPRLVLCCRSSSFICSTFICNVCFVMYVPESSFF